MKKWVTILVVCIGFFVVLSVAKNALLQSILTRGLSQATHVPVSIGHLNAQFTKAKIEVKELRIQNPGGFQDRLMLHAPEIAIDFEPAALWKGRMHFQEVRLNLSELVVIRDKNGKTNLDALKPKEAAQPSKTAPQKTGQAPKLQIDRLHLTVGKVTYKDYSVGPNPVVQEFQIGINNREYKDIDNPQTLISLIVFETLTRTTLSHLANLDLGLFQQDASGVLSHGLNLLGSNGEKIQEATQKLLNIFK